MPVNLFNWFECLAKAHNTKEEFLFVGALGTTAACNYGILIPS